jgi:hypothetical protein
MMTGVTIRPLEAADARACDEVIRSLPYHFGDEDGQRRQGIGRALVDRLTGQLRGEGRRLLLVLPLDG